MKMQMGYRPSAVPETRLTDTPQLHGRPLVRWRKWLTPPLLPSYTLGVQNYATDPLIHS